MRGKFSQDNAAQERNLEMEKKVMNSLFEEELNMEEPLKFDQKKEMALVTQLAIDFIGKTMGKFEEYRSMHKLLRKMRLNNEQLPQNVRELQQLYIGSSTARDNKKFQYHQYQHVHNFLVRLLLRRGPDR
jgi:hypothetical protein